MIEHLPFTIESLHAAYKNGTSVLEVVEEVYRRIDAVNNPGIFILQFDKAEVLDAAGALGSFDPDKPLWGIPFVIKDNIDAAAKITTAACPAFGYEAKEDAFVVTELLKAGALLIGKTNLDQFATGLVGVRSPYPPPKNAIDPEIVPGGSSSGSAVAVAHGFVSFSLGTDTAGSGRIPAGLNNIVGLKPTLGTLSASGVVPACRSVETISIFALSVEDAYRVYQSTAVYDERDAYSRFFPTPDLAAPPPSFKLGVPSKDSIRFYGDDVQAHCFSQALSRLQGMGGEIIEIDFEPLFEIAELLYFGPWVGERYTVIEHFMKENPDAVHPLTAEIIKKAESISVADAYRDFYKFADLKRSIEPALSSVDLLCVPTMPTFYSVADLEADPLGPNNNYGTYTNFVNLLDLCAIAAPTAARSDGRPGSVTFISKAGEDATIAALARAIHEKAGVALGGTNWPVPVSAPCASQPMPQEMAIAVAGAHMSGLPLNGELKRLGGRFLRAAKTASDYELYALAGGPPFRPGLVRGERGASLDIEIWALPKNAVGSFLQDIPAPLGLGTVTLQDGSKVTGFICAPDGLKGARDITEYGGWRQFILSETKGTAA